MAFVLSVLGHDRVKGLLARALGRAGACRRRCCSTGPEGVGKRTPRPAAARGPRSARAAAARPAARARPASASRGPSHAARAAQGGRRDPTSRTPQLPAAPGPGPGRAPADRHPLDIKIEQVRDARARDPGRPFEARARAFVIDDAHAMTEQAQNALLKSLEEPPATSHVVLVTSSPAGAAAHDPLALPGAAPGPLPAGASLEAHLAGRGGPRPADGRGAPARDAGRRQPRRGAGLRVGRLPRAPRASCWRSSKAAERAEPLERMAAAERLADSRGR